jgi:uncharacterized protein YbjT (DUF2867 family)
MPDPETKIALLAGASGLVGGCLLEALLDAQDYTRILALTRRPLARDDPRLANRVVAYDKLDSQLAGITCHTAFCCLGTTIRAAGSQEAFRHVDLDYVLTFARVAKAAQAQRFLVVSAAAADRDSKNFYLRTKGEMEQGLTAMRFASLDIFQPGPLLGWRREMRPLELAVGALMPILNPLLLGSVSAYRGIAATTLARAMVRCARSGRRGVYRYTYRDIVALSKKKTKRSLAA